LERVYSQEQIGNAVGRDASTINRYKQELIEPRHSVGEALLDMHAKLVPPV
jgi:hypothetical protein